MKRRLLSILLAVSVLLGLLVIPVSAGSTIPEDGFFYGVYDGKAEIYGYENPNVTELTVPTTLGGYPVGYLSENCFKDFTKLKKVVLPDCLDGIYPQAFWNCTSLEEINLPDGVTIGADAFLDCTSLKEIYIPANSHGTHRGGAFTGCTGLERAVFAPGNQVIVSTFFDGCTSLKEVVIPNTVRRIERFAFRACTSLKELTLPPSVEAVYAASLEEVPIDELVIHGVPGTTAERVAEEMECTFAPMDFPNTFPDIQAGKYYSEAVLWAAQAGVTLGKTDGTFGYNDACTRAQMVTFLWRFCGEPEPENTPLPFTDINPNAFYYKALAWGYQNYIVKGTTDTTFSPDETVTRGQVVTLLHRLDKFPSPRDYESIHYFKDVSPNSFCYEAVLWASSVGVTLGFSDDTFRPNETCTRGQIVTFLYRNLHSYYASRDIYFSSDVIC